MKTTPVNIVQRLFQKNVDIFDFIWFDISTLYYLNIGKSFTSYEPGFSESVLLSETGYFTYSYQQARQIFKITWSVKSLNVVIGQIGGYTALLWMLVKFLFNDYENFKFSNSLIGQVYTSTPDGPDAEDAQTE